MNRIKKDDQILIIKGKDRGKRGKVLEMWPQEEKLVVEGLNLRKKHVRPKKGNEKGQVVETPAALNQANVMLICPKCGQPTKVGAKIIEKKKYRLCKKCGVEF
jgi:large subunit ribosomal protein L24